MFKKNLNPLNQHQDRPRSLVINSECGWPCYRDPNSQLTYWIHRKCASSFYTEIFEKLNWKNVTTNDIDWGNDPVFSYIRDPLVRHRVGLIEWFYQNNCADLLDKNMHDENFCLMLSKICYLDIHSISILECLGKQKSLEIQWIPIDCDNIDHVSETISVIEKHSTLSQSEKQWMLELSAVHESQGSKKEYNKKILSFAPDPFITKSLEFDRWLYDNSRIRGFEPKNYSSRIEFLKTLGLSQTQAEHQADEEVKSGSYQHWDNKE